MTSLLTGLLALVVLVGAVLAAVAFTRTREGDAPSGRPAWLGPDAIRIEAALQARLIARRERSGHPPPERHPVVVELARHHAHDMAMRGIAGEIDPEGAGLLERRLRIHPDFVGALHQWQALLEPDPASTEDGIAAALAAAPGDAEALYADPRWTLGAVAVAVERGRCAACVVMGDHWATLDGRLRGDLHPSGWTVEGVVADGVEVGELAVEAVPGSGVAEARAAARPVDVRQEGRFQLHLDVPTEAGVEVRVVRGEARGARRKV